MYNGVTPDSYAADIDLRMDRIDIDNIRIKSLDGEKV